ncbi:hypothetical protein Tco_0085863 [Tanacetum coccineum]
MTSVVATLFYSSLSDGPSSLLSLHLIVQGLVMHCAFLTQRTVFQSYTIVFCWGDFICPKGFLSSVMLWLVIIVAVVGVSVMVVVVVESSYVVNSLRFRGGNIPFNTSRQSPDENFHHFSNLAP